LAVEDGELIGLGNCDFEAVVVVIRKEDDEAVALKLGSKIAVDWETGAMEDGIFQIKMSAGDGITLKGDPNDDGGHLLSEVALAFTPMTARRKELLHSPPTETVCA
jgi:hypothetical protein